MLSSNSFINWLEGYLDASKNTLSSAQVREIRKKMKEVKESTPDISNPLIALYDSSCVTSTNNPANDEFIREVESRKGATTMEELQPV
jgi:hypothetical protein